MLKIVLALRKLVFGAEHYLHGENNGFVIPQLFEA